MSDLLLTNKVYMEKLNDITVVVRAAGERTLKVCMDLIMHEVDTQNIFVVEEKPFSKALEKTFKIGMDQNKKWTLAIDADLLLLPNAIKYIVDGGAKYSDELYVYQGKILDKFRGDLKHGGPHLYNTRNLSVGLKALEKTKHNMRPESTLVKYALDNGLSFHVDDKVYALHDFYQNYRDVFRKAHFHAIKHPGYKALLPLWLEKSKNDLDYRIAVYGFINGFDSFFSSKQYPTIETLEHQWKLLNQNALFLKEKDALKTISSEEILGIVRAHNIQINDDLSILLKQRKSSFKRFFKKFKS